MFKPAYRYLRGSARGGGGGGGGGEGDIPHVPYIKWTGHHISLMQSLYGAQSTIFLYGAPSV